MAVPHFFYLLFGWLGIVVGAIAALLGVIMLIFAETLSDADRHANRAAMAVFCGGSALFLASLVAVFRLVA